MAQKPYPNWRRSLAAPKAHRTQRRMKNGDWFMRITAGRHAGAAVLFTCTGASKADCENQIANAAGQINETYEAVKAGLPTLTTIAGLLDAWERSAEFEGKSESTKKGRSDHIASIKATPLGKASASILKQAGAAGVITKWRDGEAAKRGLRAADQRIEVLNAALNWHVRQGNIAKNPAAGIADVYLGDRSDVIWTDEQVKAFRAKVRSEIDRVWAKWPPGPRRYEQINALANARDALTIALNTGMRRADIALFAWIWVRDGAIVYTPSKSRNRARTAKKAPRTVVLPVLSEAARVLARRSEIASGPILLPNRDGEKYQPKGIGDLVANIAKSLGIENHLHDAKGTFVTRLCIETDLTDQEIAGIVDWSVANVQSIKHRYVSGAAVGAALLQRFKRKAG